MPLILKKYDSMRFTSQKRSLRIFVTFAIVVLNHLVRCAPESVESSLSITENAIEGPTDTSMPLVRVVWYAPFLAGGGYASEAIDFVLGLQRTMGRDAVSVRQFAEAPNPKFVSGLSDNVRSELRAMFSSGRSSRVENSAVLAVCHATPDVFYPNGA